MLPGAVLLALVPASLAAIALGPAHAGRAQAPLEHDGTAQTRLEHGGAEQARPEPSRLAQRPGGRVASAPDLGVVAPDPAVPGLPLYLTGRSLSAGEVSAVRFTEQLVPGGRQSRGRRSGRLVTAVVANRRGAIRTAKPGTQLELTLPALAPGTWHVSLAIGHRGATTGALALRVVAASSLRAGQHCPSQWFGLGVRGLTCGRVAGGLRWEHARTGSASPVSPGSGTTSSTTTTLAPDAGKPASSPGGSPATTVASTTIPASTSTSTTPSTTTTSPAPTSIEVSLSGDPSRGATTGVLQATFGPPGSGAPAAGAITFSLSSLDAYQSGGTLELTTERAGQTSCNVRYSSVYVEQQDPSALGAPDGWRGEVSGGGDCTVSDTASGGSASQPFLTGVALSAAVSGATSLRSSTDDVRFVGPIEVATTLVAENGSQPGCFSPSCLLLWPSAADYVGEVIAGTLHVETAASATCPAAQLYDGPVPGVGAQPGATVLVPPGCSGVQASYTPPAGSTAGEGGEPISYAPAPAASFAFAAGTAVSLGAGSTSSYPPSVP